jgi:TolB protein
MTQTSQFCIQRSAFSVRLSLLVTATLLLPLSLFAQTDITTTISANQAAQTVPLALTWPIGAEGVTAAMIDQPFFRPLKRDIEFSGVFSIVPLPPNVPIDLDVAKKSGAQQLLKVNIAFSPAAAGAATTTDGRAPERELVIEARLYDMTGNVTLAKRYRGPALAMTRMAHLVANDMVRVYNGKPGLFLTQIAFASDREGHREIWLMDYDGSNQRRITTHNSITILPSWAPDDERLVYTSWQRGGSDMYIVNRRGGGRVRLTTNLALNTSATFSPVGNDIAFVGSVNGNPDIYLIKDDGTNLRRLTTSSSIESTPEWSPNGRQISFTSGRSGSPQIYVMDAEGTNVRRISFEGDWNDDAVWSPDGESLAYTSKVNGRFQIRLMNLVNSQSRIIAGEGSNEQPSFSPDGKYLVFQSNRTGRWQLYRVGIEAGDVVQLTWQGENKEPDWSKKLE